MKSIHLVDLNDPGPTLDGLDGQVELVSVGLDLHVVSLSSDPTIPLHPCQGQHLFRIFLHSVENRLDRVGGG